jgi:hypothetical protein
VADFNEAASILNAGGWVRHDGMRPGAYYYLRQSDGIQFLHVNDGRDRPTEMDRSSIARTDWSEVNAEATPLAGKPYLCRPALPGGPARLRASLARGLERSESALQLIRRLVPIKASGDLSE